MWLMAQMRQPGRRLYEDFNDRTWSDLLDELMSEDMFQLEQEVAGEKMVWPRWEHCLEYEYQLRKEAVRRATEDNFPLYQCLWAVYEDQAHKMKHWISLLTIANSSLGDNTVKDLRRENAELKKALSSARSRSPRGAWGRARTDSKPSQPNPGSLLSLPPRTMNRKAAKVAKAQVERTLAKATKEAKERRERENTMLQSRQILLASALSTTS